MSLILIKLTGLLSSFATKAHSHNLLSLPALSVVSLWNNCQLLRFIHLRDDDALPRHAILVYNVSNIYSLYNLILLIAQVSCHSKLEHFLCIDIDQFVIYRSLLSGYPQTPINCHWLTKTERLVTIYCHYVQQWHSIPLSLPVTDTHNVVRLDTSHTKASEASHTQMSLTITQS